MFKGVHNTKSIFAKEAGWFIWIFAQLLQQISFAFSSAISDQGKTQPKINIYIYIYTSIYMCVCIYFSSIQMEETIPAPERQGFKKKKA